jgi:hypothetical protein
MKKRYFYMFLPLLVLVLAGTSYGWQGRMGGAGDPYGLLQDESDFLIHPAKIADGKGTRLYGDYRFTYRGVPDWSYSVDWSTSLGVYMGSEGYDTSGNEVRHDGLLGIAFPVGSGRMGIFFDYTGTRGDYDGEGSYIGVPQPQLSYDLTSDLDAFTVSLLYGLPIGGSFKLGGEAQLAYRQEEDKTLSDDTLITLLNNPLGSYNMFPPIFANLFPFMRPYDSSYLEALFKGSLEGAIGPLETTFTLRGGVILWGENQYNFLYSVGGVPFMGSDVDGDVRGWRIGGDLWARYPVSKGLTLPFLVSVDYQDKTRDGDGLDLFGTDQVSYENEETALKLAVGGGIDMMLAKETRLAAGIYYNYLNGTNDFSYMVVPLANLIIDHGKCPDSAEHQVMLRLTGEHEFSSAFTLRGGLNFFYGWLREDYARFGIMPPNPTFQDDLSLQGSHWGIGGSVGGSLKLQRITLEPFVGGGYQSFDLNGDGESVVVGGLLYSLDEMEKTQREWFIGGGCSFLYDLP